MIHRRARPAREDRDVAGIRPVATARDGAFHRQTARRLDQRAEAQDLFGVGGGHLHPCLAGPHMRQHLRHHGVGGGGGGQAGDDHVGCLHHRGGAAAGFRAACDEFRHKIGVEVVDHQVHTIAQKAPGELAADIAQTDECDLHGSSFP
jgi:hypothetical protein